MLHVNCRSIRKYFNLLTSLLEVIKGKLFFIAVTEIWLAAMNEHIYEIEGYNFVSIIRSDKRGGGVGLYVNNDFVFKLRNDLSFSTDVLECIFVEIIQLH